MAQKIKHQLFFSHPPKAVWEYLTNPELMQLWLMKNNFKPVVGHEFQFVTNSNAELNFGGTFNCKVLEVVPFKKLSYTWQCGSIEGKVNIDSVVNWTLIPKDNGTELFLEHNGFKIMENLPLFNSMQEGWLKHMTKIGINLDTEHHADTKA